MTNEDQTWILDDMPRLGKNYFLDAMTALEADTSGVEHKEIGFVVRHFEKAPGETEAAFILEGNGMHGGRCFLAGIVREAP